MNKTKEMLFYRRTLLEICICYLFLLALFESRLLFSPFNVTQRQQAFGLPAAHRYRCDSISDPIQDVIGVSYYIDKSGSMVDPNLIARNLDSMRPFLILAQAVANASNAYVASNPPLRSAAQCALDWMYHWSKGHGMLGEVNAQGAGQRTWVLSCLLTSYLQIRDEPHLDAKVKEKVVQWLHNVTIANVAHFKATKHSKNNHYIWKAYTALASCVLVNDTALYEFGYKAIIDTFASINDNGGLSQELHRGKRVLHYHNFALSALLPCLEILYVNNVDMYSAFNHSIHRTVSLVLDGLNDSSIFAKLSGEEQEKTWEYIPPVNLGWMEIYFSRFPDHRVIPWLKKYRPMYFLYNGGNVTVIYGAPLSE